ncbi:MAG: hypothetical protein ACKVPX_09730 [Myxococcaceae bacterium]
MATNRGILRLQFRFGGRDVYFHATPGDVNPDRLSESITVQVARWGGQRVLDGSTGSPPRPVASSEQVKKYLVPGAGVAMAASVFADTRRADSFLARAEVMLQEHKDAIEPVESQDVWTLEYLSTTAAALIAEAGGVPEARRPPGEFARLAAEMGFADAEDDDPPKPKR